MAKQFLIPRPPAEIFKNPQRSGLNALGSVGVRYIEEIQYPEEGGILVWFKDLKFPRKGHPYPEAIMAMVAVKRSFISLLQFVLASPTKYFLGLLLICPGFVRGMFLNPFYKHYIWNFGYRVMEAHMLTPLRYCRCMREVYRVAKVMAERYQKIKEVITVGAEILCSIFEYENAWRYRFQDGVGEMDFLAKDLAGEFGRVFRLMASRERTGKTFSGKMPYEHKYETFEKGLRLLFRLRPDLERFTREALNEVVREEVVLDEADDYFCYTRPDYDFHGLSYEERLKLREKIDAAPNDPS